MKFFSLTVLLFLFTNVNGQSWEQKSVIKAIKQDVNDYLGWSVAIHGEYAVTGAYGDHDDANEMSSNKEGSAYIAKKNADNTWSVVQKISTSDSGGEFGHAVAISDDYIVVGAPAHEMEVTTYFNAGAAYIFEKDADGQWYEVKRVFSSDVNGYDQFGSAVTISGNTIMIGAPGKSRGGYANGGAVYVFERENEIWKEKQILKSSDEVQFAQFGSSLVVKDDKAFIGSIAGSGSNGSGAVYFFQKNETDWTEKQKLTGDEDYSGNQFGYAVDLLDKELMVGAQNEYVQTGAVYFFGYENNSWVFRQKVVAAVPAQIGYGFAVALGPDRAIVGAQRSTYVFVLKKNGDGVWVDDQKIYSPLFNTSSEDRFGRSVAMFDDDVLLGAPEADASGNPEYNPPRAGVVYAYHNTGLPLAFEKASWLTVNMRIGNPILVDYDNDGDLDLFVNYIDYDHNIDESRLYNFDGQTYTPIAQRFPGMDFSNSTILWMNVNGDAWLDLVVRYERDFKPKTEIYINNHDDTFTSNLLTFDVEWEGDFYFADYDNDTDQDLLVRINVSTDNGTVKQLKILNNNGSFSFSDSGLTFDATIRSSQPWFDYNNDGFIDFVAIQRITCDVNRLVVFQNKGGTFFQRNSTNLASLNNDINNQSGEMVWGDYDNDGDGDIMWVGQYACNTGTATSSIYINDHGSFRSGGTPFSTFVTYISLNAADLNNDGILDLVNYGDPFGTGGSNETQFLLGKNKAFSKLALYETPRSIQNGKTEIGDIDGDGDVDVVIAGPVLSLYRNNSTEGWTTPNAPPSAPLEVKAKVDRIDVNLSWLTSTDDTTPNAALTYNFELTRNDSVVVESYSISSGRRKRYIPGNVGFTTKYRYNNLKNGHYKLSVQAIDNSYAGSAFTTIEFTIMKKNDQAVSFEAIPSKTLGGASFTPVATTTSALPVIFSSTSDKITITENVVTMLKAGKVIINADQSGNNIYYAATQEQIFCINPAKPLVTATGENTENLILTSSNLSGNQWLLNGVAIANATNTTYNAVVAGTYNVKTSIEGCESEFSQEFIRKSDQTISFEVVPTQTLGSPPFALLASSSSSLPIMFSSTSDKILLSDSQVTMMKAGKVTVLADQAGSLTYNTAEQKSQTFCINPAKPVIEMTGLDTENIMLISSGTDRHQWFLNGVPVFGATNNTFSPGVAGIYTVNTTVDDCTSEQATDVSLIITGRKEYGMTITLYPNPASRQLFITIPNNDGSDISVRDMNGKLIDQRSGSQVTTELEIIDYPPGTYIVNIKNDTIHYTYKFIKQQ